MRETMNVYLSTPLCQEFFKKSQHHGHSLYRHIERKLRKLSHKTRQDNLSAIIHSNLFYRNIIRYTHDIESEIKKYQSIIKDKTIIDNVRQKMRTEKYAFSELNPLMKVLNCALIETDRLMVLLSAAHENQNFEVSNTVYSLSIKLRDKFFVIIGQIQRLSIENFDEKTVVEFLNARHLYSEMERNKIFNILAIGFIPAYRTHREAA